VRRATKWVLALGSALATVALLDLGARLIGLQTGFFLAPTSANCLQRSRLTLMEFRPECSGELYDTRFHTNALGLRGEEVRNDGSVRILAVGDSCTWGWRVDQDKSFPAVLQQKLDGQFGPQRYQVINAGVPGFTSMQGLRYLRERGMVLAPAIVIIALGFNDAVRGGDAAERLARQQWLMPLILLDDFLIEHSAAYRWSRWQGDRHGAAAQTLPVRVPLDAYKRNLVEMVELARGKGARVLFVNFAQPGPLMSSYRTAFEQTAEALGVPLLSYTGPRLDYVHPSADGDRMLAGQLFERMQADGFFARRSIPPPSGMD
jgi:lysophospholipase L1-like esterase